MPDLFSWLPIILIPIFILIIIISLSYWWYRQRKKRSSSIDHHPSQFTNIDKAYLDKLVRTASDRSMWKRDHSKKNEKNLRKVPSGLIEGKS
jgi:hypothetical protein